MTGWVSAVCFPSRQPNSLCGDDPGVSCAFADDARRRRAGNRACRGFRRCFGFPCRLSAATLACQATHLPSFLFIRTDDGFRRCRVRLRGFGTGSALSLRENPVPVARAFWPEAPDPYVAAREDVCGPVPGAVGGDKAGEDPDRISFVHAVRVMRRWIINPGALPPGGPAGRRD